MAKGEQSLRTQAVEGRYPDYHAILPKSPSRIGFKVGVDLLLGLLKAFKTAGAVVIGVSKDSVASHDKFKAKHRLAVTLAADEDIKVAEAYGVWVEKSMYGRRYMGMERATFLIDEKGVIRHIWRKVKVPGHSTDVLAAVKAL